MAAEKTERIDTMSLMPLARLACRIAASNLGDLTFPYRMTFAVTNRCQARCSMCNIWQKPTDNELSLAEIDALFCKAGRFSWVNLTGGELFQRADIEQILLTIIRRCRQLYLLNFPTNGIQTGEIVTAVDTILKQTPLPRLIVSVSMDGPPDLHDSIRGMPGCWNQALQTYRSLKRLGSERFSVYLGYTIQAANSGRFYDTIAACRNVCPGVTIDDFHVNLAHHSGHYYDNTDNDALAEPVHAESELVEIASQRRHRPFDPVSFAERRYQHHLSEFLKTGTVALTCQAAAASCFIDPQGTVFPCSMFDAPLGSLRDNDMDLYRIWRSAARQELRGHIRSGRCPGCWTPCEAYQTLLANMIKSMAYR